MALLHKATISPSKLEILQAWVPTRPWGNGVGGLEKVGTFRFDDPHGEVGIETFLLRAGDTLLQVPLTYRGHPLPGADHHLVATAEHSVLGTRWVYDGCGDPVWAATTVNAVLTGGVQAEQYTEQDGQRQVVPSTVTVVGSGTTGTQVDHVGVVEQHDEAKLTTVRTGPYELVVARVVGTAVDAPQTLTAQWEGGHGVLVGVRSS